MHGIWNIRYGGIRRKWFAGLGVAGTVSSILAGEIHVAVNGNDVNDGGAGRPVATLERAQVLARQALAGDRGKTVTVTLLSGMWRLRSPLVFTDADGGGADRMCVWRSAAGAKAVISGGIGVSGWSDAGGGRWAAPMPDGPEPEELVVNDKWTPPARTPGLLRVAKVERDPAAIEGRGWRFEMGPGAKLPDPASGALRVVVRKSWSSFVASVAATSNRVAVLSPDTWLPVLPEKQPWHPNYIVSRNNWKHMRVTLEGHPDLLVSPGTWAVDRSNNRILYMPRKGEKIEEVSAVIPLADGLLRIAGTSNAPVEGLRFEDIEFCHAGWRVPTSGWDDAQAGVRYMPPGEKRGEGESPAVRGVWWRGGGVRGCKVRLCGDDGIVLGEGCRDVQIARSEVSDVGANGISIGTTAPLQVGDPRVCGGITVGDCVVTRTGRIRLGTIGIWVAIARDCRVEHNEISDAPYTGLSLGWRWEPTPTAAGGHQVVGNHIHHVVRELCDGAGIYALGYQPGSRMTGNVIHDVRRLPEAHGSPISAIYLDQGSLGWTVESNVVYGIDDRAVNMHQPGMLGGGKLPPKTPDNAANTFCDNVFVTAQDGTAAQRQPPYGRSQKVYGPVAVADAIVAWGTNRLIAVKDWGATQADVLKQCSVGPRP